MGHSYQGLTRRVPHWGGGGDPSAEYVQYLLDKGADEVWPLTNIPLGTTDILATVASARTGTLTGWTLQNGTSPVAGESSKAPFCDGDNDYGNLHTASFASLFDGAEGGFFGWARVTDSSVWTDGEYRALMYLVADANNAVLIRKGTGSGFIQFIYKANGTVSSASVSGLTTIDWFSYALTWSVSRNEVAAYINDTQYLSATPPDTWSGSPASFIFGAEGVGSRVWDGWLAYLPFWAGYAPTASDIADMYARAG